MEYQFKPIGKRCAATGAELVPGSVCHSVLVEREGEFVRLDFSEQGWTGPPPGAVGEWKSAVPKPAEVKREPLDTNAFMSYFEQLTEEANSAHERLRYILALLLLQKRRLRLDGERQEAGEEYLQLSGSQGEGAYEVRDLHPTDDEMHSMQQELNQHLAAEWGDAAATKLDESNQ